MCDHPIILVGMMGAGKSTVGRALAKHLGWDFVDLDHEIEAITGVKIPVIFEIEGENGFRKRESHVLVDVLRRSKMVLATGGGVIIDEDNRRLLCAHGQVVYLSASAEELYQRTRLDKSRPLLKTDQPRKRIQELLFQRQAWYEEVADYKIHTGRQPVICVVQSIMVALQGPQAPS